MTLGWEDFVLPGKVIPIIIICFILPKRAGVTEYRSLMLYPTYELEEHVQ